MAQQGVSTSCPGEPGRGPRGSQKGPDREADGAMESLLPRRRFTTQSAGIDWGIVWCQSSRRVVVVALLGERLNEIWTVVNRCVFVCVCVCVCVE